jgi:hypothetical protein
MNTLCWRTLRTRFTALVVTRALVVSSVLVVVAGSPAGAATALPSGFGGIAVDASHEHVFVSSPAANAISVLDFDGNLVATIGSEPGAGSMVVRGSTLYVALTTGGAVDAIDTATYARVARYGTGTLVQPGHLVFAGGKLWTSTGPCGQWQTMLASIDLVTGAVQTHPVPQMLSYCIGLADNPEDSNTLVAWNLGLSPATTFRFDVSSGAPVEVVERRQEDQGNLKQIAVNPGGLTFVTASGAPYRIEEFRMADMAQDGIIYETGNYPNAVTTTGARNGLLAAGRFAWYDNDIDVFAVGDPSRRLFSYDFGVTSNTLYDRGLAFSRDGTRLFAVSGDSYYGTVVFNVFHLPGSASAVSASVSASTSLPGTPVTFTAQVTGDLATPTGTVAFTDGAAELGSAPVVNGQASLTVTALPVGAHTIVAAYSGDDFYDASVSGGVAHEVLSPATTTAITSSANPAPRRATVTFTAIVAPVDPRTGALTGMVQFFDGTTLLGTAAINAGQARLSTSVLIPGVHSVSARYSGDLVHTPSTSPAFTQTITKK